MQLCRRFPDFQMPEQPSELICLCHVIIILQHGKQQALTEPPGTQKEQMLSGILNQRNVICPVSPSVTMPVSAQTER